MGPRLRRTLQHNRLRLRDHPAHSRKGSRRLHHHARRDKGRARYPREAAGGEEGPAGGGVSGYSFAEACDAGGGGEGGFGGCESVFLLCEWGDDSGYGGSEYVGFQCSLLLGRVLDVCV